ncbi:extracellular solute-binding protein [Pseudarthrobacter sp. RMG13]|uniref:Extracellular solute-binding protein n=1 Tax=Pseudarthrobacter humi TaxID=2952523 RepID=A0ABT1LN65_9MICC|nr:extracellular solute-binding protein [Pseudarthrobacter humi]MCP8999877.1 extracellular solute-binding protein [Pseudarthrobacter humi]
MKKNALKVMAMSVGLGLALAACGSGSAPSSSTDDPAAATGSLRVMIPTYPLSNEGKAEFQKVVDDFNKTYPKMTIEPDFVTYDTMNEKISTSIASGSGYDVLVTGIGWIQPFAAKKVFKDLADVGVTKEDISTKTVEAMIPAVTHDEKVYGYPLIADARAVAFRKSAFIEAGLDPEKPPTSMAELKKAAEKLTKRDASGAITRPGFDFWAASGAYRQTFTTFLASTGTPLFVDGKPNFSNSEGVETLEWMKSMINNVQTFGQMNSAKKPLVYTNEAPMGMVGGAVDCSDKGIGQANCDDLSFFLLDSGTKAEFVGGDIASIGAKTKNAKAAWTFIESLIKPEANNAQAKLNSKIPATKDTAKTGQAQSNPLSKFVAENLSHAAYEGGASNWLEVRKSFNSGLDEALLGKRPAEEVLSSLAALSK